MAFLINFYNLLIHRERAVAQLVEALRYKAEVTVPIPEGVIGIFH